MSKNFTYIDLFSGCGGLSLGLHNAGWKGLFAIEKSPHAFETLRYNLIEKKRHFEWPDWLPQGNNDVNHILKNYSEHLKSLRGAVDLVAGGPPCQGFSTAGRRKENDERNSLIQSYLRFIMYVRPKMILFENVRGFTLGFKKNKSEGVAYSEYVLRALRFFGYDVAGEMVDFSEFGIPQKRTRFILVGVRTDVARTNNVSARDYFNEIRRDSRQFLVARNLPQKPTLESAISDLLKDNGVVDTPDRTKFVSGLYWASRSKYQRFLRKGVRPQQIPDSHSFANHSADVRQRFEHFILVGGRNKNLNRRVREDYLIKKHTIIPLSKDLPTPTITTLPDDYVHYSEPRILTVREYARIQSFPDWFEFKGKYTTGGKQRVKEVPRYSQIGNAIPPLYGEQSGLVLFKLLK